MDQIAADHLDRVRTAVLRKYTSAQIARWILENTKYGLDPYSFHDHEYQEAILKDTSQEVNIRKCSQVGLSETFSRAALALVNCITPYTVCYTLPTANFAGTFAKTRVDIVIEGSAKMKEAVHKTNNNNEVKQFGSSFLYIRGAASSNAPISIPVDHLMHDEWDFSDQEVLGQYVSRLTHSKWKRTHRISTPTLPNFGIDKMFQESRRHFMMCRCNHCNFYFVPDYYQHVKVPGYYGELKQITKQMLGRIRWEEAAVMCPKCGKAPSLQKEWREWVCENPDAGFKGAGYQVTPFDAPNIIKPSYLIEASLRYDRIQDFHNFNLGLPSEDTESTLTREEVVALFGRMDPPGTAAYVMGVDVGNVYHFSIGAVDAWGDMVGVHYEQVPMGIAKQRYFELKKQFNVVVSVIDSGPHAETVMSIQAEDPNCYAAVYTRNRTITTHTVVNREQDADLAKEFVRQVNVNRNRAFDAYFNFIRENHLAIRDCELKETIIAHHTSMKRVKTFDPESGEMNFTWQKTDGNDHFHHGGVYMWVAGKIRGVSRAGVALPLFAARKFEIKGPQAKGIAGMPVVRA